MIAKVVSMFGITVTTLALCACNSAPAAKELQGPVTQMRVRLRCEQRATVFECRAIAFDEGATMPLQDGDITDRVRWTADTHAVVVQGGRVLADRGGTATVTASWIDAPGAPSASVMVVADARSGDTRQAYVFEGEVRQFPSAEAIAGANVSLISEAGIAQSVTTPSHGDAQGRFRFLAVPEGTYHLRAVHDGYSATEVRVVIPGDMPRTITLLPEPRSRS